MVPRKYPTRDPASSQDLELHPLALPEIPYSPPLDYPLDAFSLLLVTPRCSAGLELHAIHAQDWLPSKISPLLPT